jgi:hypothetical protein
MRRGRGGAERVVKKLKIEFEITTATLKSIVYLQALCSLAVELQRSVALEEELLQQQLCRFMQNVAIFVFRFSFCHRHSNSRMQF